MEKTSPAVLADTVRVLPVGAEVEGKTFTGTFCPVAELIVTVADCPDPVSPAESETDTLKLQFVVSPEAVDA